MSGKDIATAGEGGSLALLRLVCGHWVGQAVHVAAKLGVADLLEDGPKTPVALAAATGSHPETLHRLLRTLASLGVFAEEADGRFALTALAEGLRTEAPGSLRAYAIFMGEGWHVRPWGELLTSVQTGRPAFHEVFGQDVFEYLGAHPEAASIFNAAMTSRTGQDNVFIIPAYDWPAGTIVDVGGGQGALLTAILGRAPDARGILYDRPQVIEAARGAIDAAGLSDRCRLVAGDFFAEVPAGSDLYLLKRVIHDWDDERAGTILRVCRAAMGPGARLHRRLSAHAASGRVPRRLCVYYATGSAADLTKPDLGGAEIRMRLGFVLDRGVTFAQAKRWLAGVDGLDESTLRPAQPIYTAAPSSAAGWSTRCPSAWACSTASASWSPVPEITIEQRFKREAFTSLGPVRSAEGLGLLQPAPALDAALERLAEAGGAAGSVRSGLMRCRLRLRRRCRPRSRRHRGPGRVPGRGSRAVPQRREVAGYGLESADRLGAGAGARQTAATPHYPDTVCRPTRRRPAEAGDGRRRGRRCGVAGRERHRTARST